jgi:hypothetical protein
MPDAVEYTLLAFGTFSVPVRYHPVNLPGWVTSSGRLIKTAKVLTIDAETCRMGIK